jgi:drug/metabolite transporter (DMT)-like permease
MENKKLAGHIALFSANIIFGMNNPISRMLMPEILSPYTLTFFRLFGGMFLFWIASLFIKKEKVPAKDIILLFFASFFALTLNQLPFFVGLSMTSPIDASIVVTTLPILTMILSAIIIKERITLMKAVGVVVGASGALLLVFSSHMHHPGKSNFCRLPDSFQRRDNEVFAYYHYEMDVFVWHHCLRALLLQPLGAN